MKVLILTVTAGQGHNITAKAIASYLENIDVQVLVLDTFYYINKLIGNTLAKGYLVTINAKTAYKQVYRHFEKRKKNSYKTSASRFANNVFAPKLCKFIKVYDPDVIICTHVFAGGIIDVIQQHNDTNAKIIGIVTDYTMHPYWEETLRSDYCVLPSEFLTVKALKKGFEPHQILPFGIPINPKFCADISKEKARLQLGIDIDKKTILLMSGSMGYGHIDKIVDKLDKSDIDLQIISICGSNMDTKQAIDSMKLNKKLYNYGYTDMVDILMSAADCIITKPGGLTTSEALAKRLPLIIINPIPGQEDRNSEFLLNNGAAMAVTDTFPLDEILHQLFDNPDRIAIMQRSIDIIRKPNSTHDLCEFVKKLGSIERVSVYNTSNQS
jgi:processive 1,2-diacylglycerol beta-glucosyltransferase